ncbi:MAG: hypothetical protein CSA61_01175 [Neptuniibacter caesariensis]|uniref:Uncharacterized protein n=1 Tax=Neptuniibacter caesariensis TaxID=207954 RepID=A0A2G6JBI6_NEPCE|nr:MAG: hypothetical protein CSA61_01175 [Neptuniibacter caesariensis]
MLVPAIYMVTPLLIDSWQGVGMPWYTPFAAWFAVIIFAFVIEQRRKDV